MDFKEKPKLPALTYKKLASSHIAANSRLLPHLPARPVVTLVTKK